MSELVSAQEEHGGKRQLSAGGMIAAAWRRLGLMSMLGVVACAAAVVTAVGLYQFKHEAQERRERIVHLRANIAGERGAIDLLNAEWTFLNRPERIQALAERFLNLKPFTMTQMVDAEALAVRPEPELLTIEDILNAAQ